MTPARKASTSRVVPFKRTLSKGDVGPDVLGLKRALVKAVVFVHKPDDPALTNQYGQKTLDAVKRFQQKVRIRVDGVYGLETHKRLMSFYDPYGAWLMGQSKGDQPAVTPRQKVANEAVWGYNNRASIHYAQIRPYVDKGHTLPQTLDCSSFSTVCYRRASCPDPNAMLFNGYGYCMEPGARLLTRDLKWKPAGDIEVGDELWACDENLSEGVKRGRMRKWRSSVVIASFPSKKPCVRVCLDTGESFVCSTDHPWLAGYSRGANLSWFRAGDLLAKRAGDRLNKRVTRVVTPWIEDTSWEAGWLAGMFDGEGWCRNREARGGRTTMIGATQAVGATAERLVETAQRRGHFHAYRVDTRDPRRDRIEITSNGHGVPGMMDFLGRIRPERLIGNFTVEGGIMLSVARPTVTSVREIGEQEVQSIQTTTGTYIAEGYAMHNTGTLAQHGVQVSLSQARPGDLVLYGNGWPYSHVAVYVGFGRVVSHGSEGGPYLCSVDYRSDRAQIRSYLL